jgi:hypothetical protein
VLSKGRWLEWIGFIFLTLSITVNIFSEDNKIWINALWGVAFILILSGIIMQKKYKKGLKTGH